MTVAIIEDNDNVRDSVKAYLELEGYSVADFSTLKDGQDYLLNNPADLLILDVMLPDGDGFLFSRKIRDRISIPIIFLTARVSESDRITGLELGADDYVVKPFSPKELVLRVGAVLRRSGNSRLSGDSASSRFFLGDEHIVINENQHSLFHGSEPVHLTLGEWNILIYLSNTPGQVFSRMQILENCLESMAEGSERTVDTHVKNIRHKLGDSKWIETVRGLGYRFNGRTE